MRSGHDLKEQQRHGSREAQLLTRAHCFLRIRGPFFAGVPIKSTMMYRGLHLGPSWQNVGHFLSEIGRLGAEGAMGTCYTNSRAYLVLEAFYFECRAQLELGPQT